MINALRTFIASFGSGEEPPRFEETDHRLAAAALLVHVMAVDGEVAPAEHQRLKLVLKREFALEDADAEDLIDHARRRDAEAVDLYGFTNILKRTLDEDGRQRIVSMMWEMVLADGDVSEFEDNLIWRAAELLGVGTRDRVRLRKQVEEGEAAGEA